MLYPEEVDQKRWEYVREGGSFVFQVKSVHEAILLATKLRDDGIRDLFRGQSNSKWNVTSTFERLSPEQADDAKIKFNRFAWWADNNPQMAEYRADANSLFAIAQHYGLATPLIDFTSQPEVAAFFALDAHGETEEGQYASIICLNEADFTHFWTQYGDKICGVSNAHKPEILKIAVDNLWRLQAQKGCFLWGSVKDIESWYDFDRIIFPLDKTQLLSLSRSNIYPENQSSLELTLADFFMNERMRDGLAALRDLAKSAGIPTKTVRGSHDMHSWCLDDATRTPDWNDLEQWQKRSSEDAETTLSATPLQFRQAISVEEFSQELLLAMNENFISRHRALGLMLSWDGGSPQDFEVLRLASSIRLLWNGMRRLPFTDAEVRASLEVAVHFFFSKQYEQSILTVIDCDDLNPDPVYVEFSGALDGRGSYSRAYVSREGLMRAFSPGFIAAVTQHKGSFPERMEEVLLIPARPWERFSFEGLRTLMVTEMIPSQAILYGGLGTEETLHRAFYFSPAELKIFGLV